MLSDFEDENCVESDTQCEPQPLGFLGSVPAHVDKLICFVAASTAIIADTYVCSQGLAEQCHGECWRLYLDKTSLIVAPTTYVMTGKKMNKALYELRRLLDRVSYDALFVSDCTTTQLPKTEPSKSAYGFQDDTDTTIRHLLYAHDPADPASDEHFPSFTYIVGFSPLLIQDACKRHAKCVCDVIECEVTLLSVAELLKAAGRVLSMSFDQELRAVLRQRLHKLQAMESLYM